MRRFILPLALVLTGCATAAPPAAAPDGPCNAEDLQRLVGQPASQSVGADILRESGARIFRWLPEGSIVTLEFRGDRVNVRLDMQNRVNGVSCG